MDLYTRIGMYFFIIGALLSIFDGVFLVSTPLRELIYITLIFTGVFAGLLNITEDEEHHFLVSAGVFLLVLLVFPQLFAGQRILSALTRFFQNAIVFVGSMAFVVATKAVLEFGSQNYHVTSIENIKLRTADIEDWQLSKSLRVWHFIVFLAVCLTFIVILLDLLPFYRSSSVFARVLAFLEWVIIIIFLADLVVLFRQEKSISSFLKNCWVDILAAIPLPGIGVLKMMRIARITHSMKFFSTESGMNTYLRKAPRRQEPITVQEHPHAKKH